MTNLSGTNLDREAGSEGTRSRKGSRNIRAQIGMVLNLDKCIGCHTCSITCKNVWTSREGVEYAWFNNVETKPGIGFPNQWENQQKWNGGWVRKINGKIEPRQGGKLRSLSNIFANPDLPEIDDYYEPFDFDYSHLQNASESKTPPTARPRSLITGERMEKIEGGPNWEEILGTEFKSRSRDVNFDQIQKDMYGEFENTFMMYLPRLCEHCLNPTCVAACPSGSIYKREEDGIVLIDQDKCRGWRMCVSACPYKKIYYNWETGKSEKCTFCYPRIEAGEPTVCSETCVGRIRYLGVLLYDADRIEAAASCENEQDLYSQQLDIFLDPNDEDVRAEARLAGIPESWLTAAQESPVYKMAMDWKVAFPLHPEFRTLPMVWYVPPLSPIQAAAEHDQIGMEGDIPDVRSLRIPVRYLANLLTAGKEEPIVQALERMLAMRSYMRSLTVDNEVNTALLDRVDLTELQVEEMYRYMAIANYEDRFVIPTSHREYAGATFDAYGEQGGCGFSFGSGCSTGNSETNLFGGNKKPQRSGGGIPIKIPIKVEPLK
jgi:nitrate reductase beta subunit